MTAKQKAKELVGIYQLATMSKATARGCALICVDEVELQAKNWGVVSVKAYWNKVKQEIEKL